MAETFLQAIVSRTLLSDGAMGTQLQALGLEAGEAGDHWNITHPDRVEQVQRAYADAGSDLLITNTFGACRLMLARHGFEDEVVAINSAGVAIARRAFGARPGFVLGDIGPFGGLLEPYGEATEVEVRDAFDEQARALVAAGVDGIVVETQTALEETAIAVRSAQDAGAPCVIASFAFGVRKDGSDLATMMGVTPEAAAGFCRSAGVQAIGVNCGSGVDMDWAIRVTGRYRRVCDLPVIAQPNAGQPELVGTRVVYRQTPAQMVQRTAALVAAGANVVGACCGSTPAHIAAMRARLDAMATAAS